MNVIKNRTLFFITLCVVLPVYNVIAFVIPFHRGAGFWTGYGFSTLAILLMAGISLYAFDRENLRSKVYGIPLLSVAWRYLIIQVIVGLVQMLLDFIPIPFQIGLVLNTILLGICLVGLIVMEASKGEIERIDAKIKEKVFYIKSLQADVEGLRNRASDTPLKKTLKDLAETIRFSDPMSSPQLAAIENKIEAKAAALADAVERADNAAATALCNELQQLFAERNRKCKILK